MTNTKWWMSMPTAPKIMHEKETNYINCGIGSDSNVILFLRFATKL